MARYGTRVVSQTAQLAGAPSGTTVNGYIGYWGASANTGFRLRRCKVGVRTTNAAPPTSQQLEVAIFRQTVAPAGTGLATAIPGEAFEVWTVADPTAGVITTTAATIGTTGPTINTNPLDGIAANTQGYEDVPWEFMEEIVCNKATANGIAFVNIGQTLPANHFIVLSIEIEV